ncbi:hypothetical protein L1987_43759 [Smallanthus sonchifolius]|uniref:Uncharacterized protein n=1 Tax=Smallanthus sonchifolius TaxID=185202 RepID=A0ACB9GN73_9ASTR|nr:hypothetical protein L1987_43759 [Smallanthus sonchifolius]
MVLSQYTEHWIIGYDDVNTTLSPALCPVSRPCLISSPIGLRFKAWFGFLLQPVSVLHILYVTVYELEHLKISFFLLEHNYEFCNRIVLFHHTTCMLLNVWLIFPVQFDFFFQKHLRELKMKVLKLMYAMMMMTDMAGVFWDNAQAQVNSGGGSACLNQLVPCLSYLNNQQAGRDPPDSCCDPLKSVIKSNPECLCSMISNQGTKNAERAGINVTQAQELPARCGQHVNPISCLTTTSKNTPGSSDSQKMRYSKIYSFMLIAALYEVGGWLTGLLTKLLTEIETKRGWITLAGGGGDSCWPLSSIQKAVNRKGVLWRWRPAICRTAEKTNCRAAGDLSPEKQFAAGVYSPSLMIDNTIWNSALSVDVGSENFPVFSNSSSPSLLRESTDPDHRQGPNLGHAPYNTSTPARFPPSRRTRRRNHGQWRRRGLELKKMLQEHHLTSAPKAVRVSMRTPVWIFMWRGPVILTLSDFRF